MTIHRRNAKRDISEPEIVEALTKAGATVHRVSGTGIPDLLIGFRGKTYLAEAKTGKRKLNENQMKFFDEWRGFPPVIFRSVDDVTEWVNSPAARGV